MWEAIAVLQNPAGRCKGRGICLRGGLQPAIMFQSTEIFTAKKLII